MGLVYFSSNKTSRPNVVSVARRKNARFTPEMLARMGCKACPLDMEERRLEHPKMRPTGTVNPLVYVLGEAPGRDEDKGDEQFIGVSGDMMRDTLRQAFKLRRGDDENEFVRWNNTIRCHPDKNRDPDPVELLCCMPKQFDDIERTRPKVVLAVGKYALTALTGLEDKTKISQWRGRKMAFEVGDHKFWIVPTNHPAYILRAEGSEAKTKSERAERDLKRFFIRDVKLAVDLATLEQPPKFVLRAANVYDGVKVLRNFGEIMTALHRFEGGRFTGMDLETTGFRPYDQGAAILTASLWDYRANRGIAFPINHPEAGFTKAQRTEITEAFREVLLSTEVWCHNLNFEFEWLCWQYGPELVHRVNGHDTMAQAYILDERGGGLGLDSLSLIHLGIRIKELSELDKADMRNEPLEKVLPYNGVDSKVCSLVAGIQHDLLCESCLDSVYDDQRKRSTTIAITQFLGVVPDFSAVSQLNEKFRDLENNAVSEVTRLPEVAKYIEQHDRDFSVTAPKSVSKLLVHLGFNQAAASSDEKILKEIKHPVAESILKVREYKKLRSTYIVPFQPNGKNIQDDLLIHTQFKHNLTTTGRFSSTDPNMQNIPIREHPEMRGIITAAADIRRKYAFNKYLVDLGDDVWIVSCDQGQIEARVVGMASKDKFLCKSIWEGYDIHMEWSERLAHRVPRLVGGKAAIKDKEVMKKFRSMVKSKWTFPLFFKSSLYSVCQSLDCDEDDLGPLFEDFWDQFSGVAEWHEREIKSYEENGYVVTLTGRRRNGPMTVNMLVNAPVQGTASDIVVDAMMRLSKFAVENDRMDVHPRLNVHDDLTTYCPNRNLDDCIDIICRHMLTCDFWFLNVPLAVEVKIGRNWGDMKEIAVLTSEDYK